MKLKVLGGDGGVAPGFATTSFLINSNILVDAGSVATNLSLKDQRKVDYVFISHTHLDHVKDLCFLVDNVFTHRKKPIEIISTQPILYLLREHIFNNKIWPDFSKISNGTCPIFAYKPIEQEITIGKIQFRIYPVNHPVPAIGFIVKENQKKSIVITGDTGPTQLLWDEANKEKHLQAIFTEIAFPNRLEKIAEAAGHFSPKMFQEEIKKVTASAQYMIYHLKPEYLAELKKEIKKMDVKGLKFIKAKQTYVF